MKWIIAASVIFVYLMIIAFVQHIMGGGYISKSTEQKYIRNIKQFETLSERHLYVYSDTLTSIIKHPYQLVDPFHKWYIMDDVGNVRPNSELERLCDSISATYKDPKNQYK